MKSGMEPKIERSVNGADHLGTGTNFIRTVPKIERSVIGALT
jgi:hypothetical protein